MSLARLPSPGNLLLLFRPSLPVVMGWRTEALRAQHLCQWCTLHALHDKKHLVLEYPAMQCVRDWYPALVSHAKSTMQLFMWQHDFMGMYCTLRLF